ncbi:MAG TPA: FGGY family carbohydrate kinase [Amycolatopsis sp.]|nr:FGGY family carbohydrate kinase [Amycolatopsis sp.]
MSYVVGIDCSTTSAKAVVFDEAGACVAQGRAGLDTAMPRPGRHEQDPRRWWSATEQALRQAIAAVGPDRVAAIGVTHQRETFACLDRDGTALRPAILWLDGRAGEQAAAAGTERVHRLSGKPPDITPALYKLMWLREHEPSIMDRMARVVDVGGYLLHELTGRWVTGWGSADPLGLLDMSTFEYAPELLDLAGIGAAQLPELVPPGTVVGEFESIPVVASVGDGQAAGLGADVLAPGRAYLNLGTGIASGTPSPVYRAARAFRTLASPLAGDYTLETLLSSGTYLVSWFARQFDGGGEVPGEGLQAAAAALPPGADGLMTLPYWNSAQTPNWDPFASGAVIGWRGVHGPAHLYRSLLEGIAFELRLQTEGVAAEQGTPIVEYRAMGGGSRSPLWTQMIADVTGRPVTVCAETETSALGAAIQAAAAVGLHGDLRASARAMTRFSRTVEPSSSAYEPFFEIYQRLYGQLAETLAALHRTRE